MNLPPQTTWPGGTGRTGSQAQCGCQAEGVVDPTLFSCEVDCGSDGHRFGSGTYHGISLAASIQKHFGTWSLYHFHIEDPVRFTQSLRFTIEHGHANDQSNDYSSVAYWYQTQPSDSVADLPPVGTRLPRRWPEHGLWDE